MRAHERERAPHGQVKELKFFGAVRPFDRIEKTQSGSLHQLPRKHYRQLRTPDGHQTCRPETLGIAVETKLAHETWGLIPAAALYFAGSPPPDLLQAALGAFRGEEGAPAADVVAIPRGPGWVQVVALTLRGTNTIFVMDGSARCQAEA